MNLSSLANSIQQAAIITDPKGSILEWNEFAEALYGWTRADAVGRNVIELLVAPGQEEIIQQRVAAMVRGVGWGGRFLVRNRNGTEFEIYVVTAPLTEGGKVQGILGMSVPVARSGGAGTLSALSPREREVFDQTLLGKSSADIAATLGISVRTVESHHRSIHQKLGVNSRVELILYAARNGLMPIESHP